MRQDPRGEGIDSGDAFAPSLSMDAVGTLALGLVVGTFVLPPTGAPMVFDAAYPPAVILYVVEGTTLAVIGALAHAALRSQAGRRTGERGDEMRPLAPAVHHYSVDPLTAREIQVLRMAASGRCADELARELYLSRNTVKTHLAHVYDKLGAHNRAEAIACALRERWLDPEDVAGSASEPQSTAAR